MLEEEDGDKGGGIEEEKEVDKRGEGERRWRM